MNSFFKSKNISLKWNHQVVQLKKIKNDFWLLREMRGLMPENNPLKFKIAEFYTITCTIKEHKRKKKVKLFNLTCIIYDRHPIRIYFSIKVPIFFFTWNLSIFVINTIALLTFPFQHNPVLIKPVYELLSSVLSIEWN